MKKIIFTVVISACIYLNSYSQVLNHEQDEGTLNLSEIKSSFNPEANVSEWWNFYDAMRIYITGSPSPKNVYTLLFPDTVFSISNESGKLTLSRTRHHAVGMVFCPYSGVFSYAGYHEFKEKQPYRLDSIAIYYNYERFTENNIPDTLIVNIYKPQKLLYYKSNDLPRGCSMKYDLANNKGANYSMEVKILLDHKDTISYKGRGKGLIYIPLTNFDINPGSYGAPVAVTWSFKPAFSWSLSDTLNADFELLPHSKINHFYFWNFTDYQETEINEWNNGVFIFSWTNYPRYKYESSNGNVFWRGTSFSGKTCYPMALFKITYDPSWIGVDEEEMLPEAVFPNPASRTITIKNIDFQQFSKIEIYNSLGQKVKSYQITPQMTTQSSLQIDISDLTNDLYIYQLIGNKSKIDGRFTVKR